jgi:hypothetical protein
MSNSAQQESETDQLLPPSESLPNNKNRCAAAAFVVLALGLSGISALTLYKSIQEGDITGIALGSVSAAASLGLASLSLFFGCRKYPASKPTSHHDIESQLKTHQLGR